MDEILFDALERILNSKNPMSSLAEIYSIDSDEYSIISTMIVPDEGYASPNVGNSFETFLAEWAAKLPKKYVEESTKLLRQQVIDVNQLLYRATVEVGLERPKYGLIVGRIQSGKTSHIIGLISSILDQNFESIEPDLIIVLSGLAEDLRLQTTRRIQSIFGLEKVFPGLKNDFSRTIDEYETDDGLYESIEEQFRSGNRIIVIKKNCDVLQELLDKLPIYRNHNILIIDDEADHASIDNNRSRNSRNYDNNTNPSLTNRLLRTLISSFSDNHVWYLGYTASPFANLLIQPFFSRRIDPLGLTLFPRDVLYSLEPPSSYTGIETYFDDMRFINIVSVEERMSEQQLLDFILRHIVTLKLREFRGKDTVKVHSSMIHTALETDEHLDIAYRILAIIDDEVLESSEYNRLNARIETILQDYRHTPEFKRVSEYYRQLKWDEFSRDAERIKIVEMNRRKLDETDIESGILRNLDYESNYCNYIVIGGSRLSRGLTLEDLTNTWFTRTAQTPNYDTMMQMARWCGYREDYLNLTRINTTEEIIEYFRNIIAVENEVRDKIRSDFVDGIKPIDTIHWIREHEGMNICRRDAIVAPQVRILGGIPTSTLWSYDVPYSTSKTPPNPSRDIIFESFISMIKNIDFTSKRESPNKSFDVLRDIDSKHVMGFLRQFIDSYESNDWRHTPSHLRLFVDILKYEKWDIGIHSPKSNPTLNPLYEFDSVDLRLIQRASDERRFSIINSGDDDQFHQTNPMIMFYIVNPDSTDVNGERNFDDVSKQPAVLFGIFLSSDDVDTSSWLEYAAGRYEND